MYMYMYSVVELRLQRCDPPHFFVHPTMTTLVPVFLLLCVVYMLLCSLSSALQVYHLGRPQLNPGVVVCLHNIHTCTIA